MIRGPAVGPRRPDVARGLSCSRANGVVPGIRRTQGGGIAAPGASVGGEDLTAPRPEHVVPNTVPEPRWRGRPPRVVVGSDAPSGCCSTERPAFSSTRTTAGHGFADAAVGGKTWLSHHTAAMPGATRLKVVKAFLQGTARRGALAIASVKARRGGLRETRLHTRRGARSWKQGAGGTLPVGDEPAAGYLCAPASMPRSARTRGHHAQCPEGCPRQTRRRERPGPGRPVRVWPPELVLVVADPTPTPPAPSASAAGALA